MPCEPTEKCRFPSRYSSGNFVSASQYITELICEKKAQQSKKDLPIKFWNLPEWESFYRQQIGSACKLLKSYSASSIIKALRSNEAYNIYSLRAPHLLPLIAKEQLIIDARKLNHKEQPVVRHDVLAKPRESKPDKNILDILDD